MKTLYSITLMCFFSLSLCSQTHIATVLHPEAIANHNQRKIVRDSSENVYVVFQEYESQQTVIKGLKYTSLTDEWSNPVTIAIGKNPSIAISGDNRIFLVYESSAATRQIKYKYSANFTNWSADSIVSNTNFNNTLPVADVDYEGTLNILWKQHNDDFSVSLMYARVSYNLTLDRSQITAKNNISDIAIANHLQTWSNDLYFAVRYNTDSLAFFMTEDYMQNIDTLYKAKGSHPCITFNSVDLGMVYETDFSFMYLNTNSEIVEVDKMFDEYLYSGILDLGQVDQICIDDIIPTVGYSFLFMRNDTLFHGYTLGADWNSVQIMEQISGGSITNPSIAYKQYNGAFVDFIWMEDAGDSFHIQYLHDEKYTYNNISPYPVHRKGFALEAFPNPFSEHIYISVYTEEEQPVPYLQIYDLQGHLIMSTYPEDINKKEYGVQWDGTNSHGLKVRPGTYITVASYDNKRTIGKIVFN